MRNGNVAVAVVIADYAKSGLFDVVVIEHVGEYGGIKVEAAIARQNLTDDMQLTRVDQAGEHQIVKRLVVQSRIAGPGHHSAHAADSGDLVRLFIGVE